MNKKILRYTLSFLVLLFALLGWYSIYRAIYVPQASDWLMPIVWFSLFFVFFSLAAVLTKKRYPVEVISAAAILTSLIFSLKLSHLISLIITFLIISLAVGKIRKDLQLNIKVDIRKTLRSGSIYIILALGIAVASQYYSSVKDSTIENIIPKFKMEWLTSSLTSQILSNLNPNFKDLDNQGLTVDQLILSSGKDQLVREFLQPGLDDVSTNFVQDSQNLILEKGREQFAKTVGHEITGQEKFSDVIAEIVNNKINSFIAPNFSGENFPLLPLILGLILFLTVIPLGSFLSPVWIVLANLFS